MKKQRQHSHTQKQGASTPSGSIGTEQPHGDDRSHQAFLANLYSELRTPVEAVIKYSAMLLEDARQQGQESFIPDLVRIQTLGKKLLALVDESLHDTGLDVGWADKELKDISVRLRHELRTPLNAIIGYSEILIEDAAAGGLKEFIPDLEKIRSAGKSFLSFIADIDRFMGRPCRGTSPVQAPSDATPMIRNTLSDIPPLEEIRSSSAHVARGRLLVVDDNEVSRDLICRQLERQGHVIAAAENGRQALELLLNETFDMVILDLLMPEMSGYKVLQELKSSDVYRDVPVVVVSALDEMDSVVRCIQMGAEDYLLKPFNPVLLNARIRTCLESRRLRELNEALELRNLKQEVQLIAESRAMQQVLHTMHAVSRSLVNVLIHGESGTGKEVIARMIHLGSDRKDRPFVAVNCASIPESLMESEFFGYEKGAFTGAVGSRGGRFEEANGGTLFLDEISDMPLTMQPKFLRVIQESEGVRLGSNRPVRYDIRIISATNRDLRREVEQGRFREDLFYRIFSVEIHIPPLRERQEDIVPLTQFFMNRVSRQFEKNIKGFSSELLNFFKVYPWPGNVRQLLHEVEHMVVLTPEGERTTLKHCSPELQKWRKSRSLSPIQRQSILSLPKRVEETEIACIKEALLQTNGNKLQASKLLGITRQGLDKKLKRYKIGEESKKHK